MRMTATAYNNLHPDYRGNYRGRPHALALDPTTGGTTLQPVEFVEPLKTCTGYIAVRTDETGRRVWSVVRHNKTLVDGCDSRDRALRLARDWFGDAWLSLWDADRGEFTTDLRTGA